MKVHTFQKKRKRSGNMKAHNIILEFDPSGMCETNIYREIKENPEDQERPGGRWMTAPQ
jgi:hypothetical protein